MDKPAIAGGAPTFKETLRLNRPPTKTFAKEILGKMESPLSTAMLTNSENVQKLENSITSYIGRKHCVAISSASTALTLTLKAMKTRGDVLVPAFTFPATAHAASWCGLNVIPVDCYKDTFNIDTEDLEKKITDKTECIIPVHVFGNPCNVNEIQSIAEEHDIKVVYDSAHGFGAKYKEKKIGNFGYAEIFSGTPTKTFSTIEGGMVLTDDEDLVKKLRILRNYGIYKDDCEMPGMSARMSELNAIVGLVMLEHIEEGIERREDIVKKYKNALKNVPGLAFQKITPGGVSAHKDFPIVVNDEFGITRDKLSECLEKENITARKYFYPPIHLLSCYKYMKKYSLPNAEFLSQRILCLPIFNELTDEEVDKVVEAIVKIREFFVNNKQ
jgi:dTDP-4-amino-4,6-dideoxygalactose transaminase